MCYGPLHQDLLKRYQPVYTPDNIAYSGTFRMTRKRGTMQKRKNECGVIVQDKKWSIRNRQAKRPGNSVMQNGESGD